MRKRSIIPAPSTHAGYPRIGAVWRAFAAGTLAGVAGLSGAAHADCALPDHATAANPSKPGARPAGKPTKKPDGIEGTTSARKPTEPPRGMVTGGVAPATHPSRVPIVRPDVVEAPMLGGVEAPVQPPAKKPLMPKPEPKQRPQMDGGIGAVQAPARPMHFHPHGPDDPCRPAVAYVVRFDRHEREG